MCSICQKKPGVHTDVAPLHPNVVSIMCDDCHKAFVTFAKSDRAFVHENPRYHRGFCTHWGLSNTEQWCESHTRFYITTLNKDVD